MTEARRCTAKAKSTGRQCDGPPIRGATVCRHHGGSAPQVRRAAARRLQRQQLQGDLGRLLEELEIAASDVHPVQLLTGALARCSAMVAVLGALVGGLGVDNKGDGTKLYGPDHLGDGRPHVLTEMYGVWLDRQSRTAKLCLDAGIDERAVRLEEQRAGLIVDVFRKVFADDELGLTVAQRRSAAMVAARHLRAIESVS